MVPRPGAVGRFTRDRARRGVKLGVGQVLPHELPRRLVGARDEHAMAARADARGDGGDLLRRLAQTEDDLREALADRAVVVDAGKAEVLVGRFAEGGEQPRLGVGHRQPTFADPGQEVLQLGRCHARIPSVSLTFNRSIRLN